MWSGGGDYSSLHRLESEEKMMIKIEYKKDLILLKKHEISPIIAEYICDYFRLLTKENHTEDLTELGAIYFLERLEDEENYGLMGLTKPLEQSFPEFSELLILKKLNENKKILHSCFVMSNSYAISIFAEIGTLKNSTEEHLLSDSVTKEIKIREDN